jgi:hypothetical protein
MLMQIAQDSPGIFASQYLNYPIAASQQVLPEAVLLSSSDCGERHPACHKQFCLLIWLQRVRTLMIRCVLQGSKTVGRMYMVDAVGTSGRLLRCCCVINMILKHRPLKVMIEKTASAIYFVEYLKPFAVTKEYRFPLST